MTLAIAKTRRLLAAAVVLLLAVFVFAPVVEAASCGPEIPAAEAVLHDGSSPENHGAGDPAHGICAHGHCHHGSTAGTPSTEAMLRLFDAPLDQRPAGADAPSSYIAEGPTRPPRT